MSHSSVEHRQRPASGWNAWGNHHLLFGGKTWWPWQAGPCIRKLCHSYLPQPWDQEVQSQAAFRLKESHLLFQQSCRWYGPLVLYTQHCLIFVCRLMEGVDNDLTSDWANRVFVLLKVWLLGVVVLTSPSWRLVGPTTNTRPRGTAGHVSVVWLWT